VVYIISLGTGNDLSREMGWGRAYEPKEEVNVGEELKIYASAEIFMFDLWKVVITPPDNEKSTIEYMLNYFNIGFDAHVAHRFHSDRNAHPKMFRARAINAMWYFCQAIGSVCSGSMFPLKDVVTLQLDGKEVEIPEACRTLVFLNFPNYQAGVEIWKSDSEDHAVAMDDSLLEVVSIGNISHDAEIRIHCSTGHKVGQASQIKITLKQKVAVAYDGEPIMQDPCTVHLSCFCKIPLLLHPKSGLKSNITKVSPTGSEKTAPTTQTDTLPYK